MSLERLRARYLAGGLPKAAYIEQMHQLHARLFEYAAYIRDTDIARIEITDGQVMLVSRESDLRIICDPADRRAAPIETLNFGHYERDEAAMLYRLIGPKDVVFDIGANIGWYTLNIAKRFPSATVHAFEPVPDTYAHLCTNVECNRVTSALTYNFGFSDAEKEITFFVDPHESVSASAANLMERPEVKEVRCRVTTLDGFLAERGVGLDVIKCDVEGAELFVYRGGIASIREHQPVILTEMLRKWSAKFGYSPNEIISLLSSVGYKCFTVRDQCLEEFLAMEEDTQATAFFFLHSTRHAEQIASLIRPVWPAAETE